MSTRDHPRLSKERPDSENGPEKMATAARDVNPLSHPVHARGYPPQGALYPVKARFPPTSVSKTLIFRRSSTEQRNGSRSKTTISASIPGSRVPRYSSEKEAKHEAVV